VNHPVLILLSESPSPDSANVLDNFSRLPVSVIVKPPTSNAGKLCGVEEQNCNEQCPQIKSPVCSWCVIWLFLLSLGMERIHFSTEKTDVSFLGYNGEPAFSGMRFSLSVTKFKANLNTNVLYGHKRH